MKKLCLSLLLALSLLACSRPQSTTSTIQTTPDVSIVDHWVENQPSGILSITFTVMNTLLKKVKVAVVCYYLDGKLFNRSIPQSIEPGKSAKFMVRGTKACPSNLGCGDKLDCKVENVE